MSRRDQELGPKKPEPTLQEINQAMLNKMDEQGNYWKLMLQYLLERTLTKPMVVPSVYTKNGDQPINGQDYAAVRLRANVTGATLTINGGISIPITEMYQQIVTGPISQVSVAGLPTGGIVYVQFLNAEAAKMGVMGSSNDTVNSETNPLYTELTGSLAPKQGGMVMVNSNQTLDLATGGGTLTITIQPPTGQLWRGRGFQLNNFPYPTGATGDQYFSVLMASVGFLIATTSNLSILGGNVDGTAGAITWPSPSDAWYKMLSMLVATHAQPVRFVLENYSSAANTGILGFSTAWEVEAIDDIT